MPDCCLSPPQLLEKKKRVQLKDMGEDLECLCQIMRTVGPRLDHEKAKVDFADVHFYRLSEPRNEALCWLAASVGVCWVVMSHQALTQLFANTSAWLNAGRKQLSSPSSSLLPQSLMDQYFARMRSLMNNKELPARIRFLLQDTVELRENNWVPRKAFIDNGPKTINQIRQDAVKVCWAPAGLLEAWLDADISSALCHQDLGVFIPAPMSQGMRMDFFLESPFIPNRVKLDRDTLGGLADMFGQMPGPLGRRRRSLSLCLFAPKANVWFCSPGSGIGTGPGVIQDRYSPTMGRHRTNPLFNGHIAPPPQSQFDIGPKSFVKSNQVSEGNPPGGGGGRGQLNRPSPLCVRQVQNQHFLNQNQNHMAQQQVQSKDMPPRFSKKGQINADEVTEADERWCSGLSPPGGGGLRPHRSVLAR